MIDTIYITGSIYYQEDIISSSKDYNITTPQDVRDQIENVSTEKVLLQVGSDGGNILAASEMYYDLINSGLDIHTVGVNRIGSVATVLFLLPDDINKRKVAKGTKAYIHAPVSYTQGNFKSHLLRAKTLAGFTDMFSDFYASKLNKTSEEVVDIMLNDTVWTDKEVVSNGMASGIVDINYSKDNIENIEMSLSNDQLEKASKVLKDLTKTI